MVHDYPEPPEEKTKHIEARVYVSFTIEYDCPDDWEVSDIESDIKENLNDFAWNDETIEDIEVI